MKSELFEYELTVPASAIDAMEHVNNLNYLEWCLEAASGHWEQNTTKALRERFVWYVLKHEISYHSPAFEGDRITVSTWVNYSEGVRSEREYRIYRKKDNRLLAEAKTLWCLLNANSQKPTKITEEIRNLFHHNKESESD